MSRTLTRTSVHTPPPAPEPRGLARVGATARLKLGEIFRSESRVFYLILGVTTLLVVFGLVMVLSASTVTSHLDGEGFTGRFGKQLIFALIGIPLMLMMSRAPLGFWKKWGRLALWITAGVQLLVFVPGIGIEAGGNRNWINLFGYNAQPSEAIKLSLAIFLGIALPVSISRFGQTHRALMPLLAGVALMVLVFLGGDLGTIFILLLVSFGAVLFAGIRLRLLVIPLMIVSATVAIMAFFSSSRVTRIINFYSLVCTDDSVNDCWQPMHGMWALARGGLFGVGFGNSKLKWAWLPAADNDYIFAIIGEELGLIGCLVLLALLVVLAFGLVRVIREATDPMIRITTGAILFWFCGQAFLNIAVVLGLVPVLGLPIPFVSSGGTALLTALMATGVVLSFARHNNKTSQG